MARGDVLFYRPGPNDCVGKLVARFTKGPFCHVELDLGDGTMLGVQGDGVKIRSKQSPQDIATPRPYGSAERELGIAWGRLHIGNPYGKLSIFSNILKVLGIPLYLGQHDRMTCSEFVAHVLDEMGIELGELEDSYPNVSPNDLARLFKLI